MPADSKRLLIERNRADCAYRCDLYAHNQDFSEEYKALVKDTLLLINSGMLDKTVALLFSRSGKGKQHQMLYEQLQAWLRNMGYIETEQHLVEALLNPEKSLEHAMTNEALAFLGWVRRFSDGLSDSPPSADESNEMPNPELADSPCFHPVEPIPTDQHHRRKVIAWNCALTNFVNDERNYSSEYIKALKSLPVLLRTNGLGATFAYLDYKKKKNPHYAFLFQHVSSYLFPGLLFNDVVSHLRLHVDSFKTRSLTIELIAFAVWLRYYVEGNNPSEHED